MDFDGTPPSGEVSPVEDSELEDNIPNGQFEKALPSQSEGTLWKDQDKMEGEKIIPKSDASRADHRILPSEILER